MLRIVNLNVVADGARQLLGEFLISRAEVPDLRCDAADDVQRKLALVRFAQPALLRELLQNACAIAFGICPRQGERGPKPDACDHDQDQPEQQTSKAEAGFRKRIHVGILGE
jgi:hypothetical protein